MTLPVNFVPAQAGHRDAMAALFREVCRAGDALPFTEDTPDSAFDAMWLATSVQAHVVLFEGEVVGMFKLNANLPGRASHVGSATYLVRPDMQGKGIGGAMLRESIRLAGAAGFRSIQFNFVVSTNRPAVALYEKHGFVVAGALREAFLHRELGYVDAYVMTRPIEQSGP
ncbi:GNAT family N-acetyltransferase [Massilia sp. ST3]|uniref:GNAT family N-acetyltransferase n=1 Tax=Massilia sp. ST3 TaxID=2824903 RepID=UPI001B828D6A|nr:GNAT family N-acetyltransferase [Massilia sp. ST3]MBQ5948268.1 GNAT family N-acetyltransferase [Massilia sp. ST3]